MSIQTKDWYARLNTMPGLEGPKFMVSGTVTTPSSNTEASLTLAPRQDKSTGIRLDLHLDDNGIGLPALTDKTVSYSQAGGSGITHVDIYYNDERLVRIENVEIVS